MGRPDKYVGLRVREAFEDANRPPRLPLRGAWAAGDDPAVAPEKVVRCIVRGGAHGRLLEEEGQARLAQRRDIRCAGEPGGRDLRADAPNEPWLTDITGFGPPGGKARLSPVLDCFDGALPARPIGASPDAALADSSLEEACGTLSEGRGPRPAWTAAAAIAGPVG